MKKWMIAALCVCLLLGCAYAQEDEIAIILNENEITVNGEVISESTDERVYLARSIETHDDVPDDLEGLENRVITISDAGVYRISGAAEDAQIAVRAQADDAVRIILDGAEISCRTAPAIAVYSALESAHPGQYGVAIELADGSLSIINGSHTEEISDDDIKLSGAISSLVSLGFDGAGYLNVNGDNEGIEVKFGHMTFDGGNIIVSSGDDPLNASEDNVSVITVNDGTLHLQVRPDEDGEGDGMDSNGSIVINGGAVSSYAHPDSMDSGIDSDLGCIINGGIVLGAGNMYDEISEESAQLFMALQFAQRMDEMIVLTTTDGVFVAMIEENEGYTSFVISSPEVAEGDYHLYAGGELTLEDGRILYTPGRQLQHGGSFGRNFGRTGKHPEPEGVYEIPENRKLPGGFEGSGDIESFDRKYRPAGKGFNSERRVEETKSNEIAEPSVIFHLSSGGNMFNGIRIAE